MISPIPRPLLSDGPNGRRLVVLFVLKEEFGEADCPQGSDGSEAEGQRVVEEGLPRV